ncbi:hypothetical protein TELCIR_06153, partial [Teladorsagia circumcincta]
MASRLEPADEEITAIGSEELTSTQSSEPISRRRLAFKPPLEPRPLSMASNRPDITSHECAPGAGCGKDFDGVMRIMAKRKVEKNKEQTKNYYFNLLKHVKQSISLDEGNQLDKFPSEIIVSLKPMTYADASYVDANGSRRSSGPRPEVRLFAGKDTEVGRVVLNATELAPAVGLSLNKYALFEERLRKEREDREALKSKRSRNAQVNTEPSYTVSISHNFVLNEDIMKDGLCEENVRDAIVAEIYCLLLTADSNNFVHRVNWNQNSSEPSYTVSISHNFVLNEDIMKDGLCEENCGMTPIVELVYSVRTAPRLREPWRIMVSLLERDYGEALLDTARKRPIDVTNERKEDPPSKMRPVRNSRNKLTPQSHVGSPLNVIQEEAPQTPVVQPVLAESSVVLEEYDSFAEQYNALRGKKSAQQLCPTSFAHDFLSSLRTPDKTPAKNSKPEED